MLEGIAVVKGISSAEKGKVKMAEKRKYQKDVLCLYSHNCSIFSCSKKHFIEKYTYFS